MSLVFVFLSRDVSNLFPHRMDLSSPFLTFLEVVFPTLPSPVYHRHRSESMYPVHLFLRGGDHRMTTEKLVKTTCCALIGFRALFLSRAGESSSRQQKGMEILKLDSKPRVRTPLHRALLSVVSCFYQLLSGHAMIDPFLKGELAVM